MRTGWDVKAINQDTIFLMAQWVRNLPTVHKTQEMQGQSLGREDPPEKEMATHSSSLIWKIPWTEEPGGLQSKGSQRVGHDWAGRQGTHTNNVKEDLNAQMTTRGSISMLASAPFKVESTSPAPNGSGSFRRLRFLNRLHHLKQSQAFVLL